MSGNAINAQEQTLQQGSYPIRIPSLQERPQNPIPSDRLGPSNLGGTNRDSLNVEAARLGIAARPPAAARPTPPAAARPTQQSTWDRLRAQGLTRVPGVGEQGQGQGQLPAASRQPSGRGFRVRRGPIQAQGNSLFTRRARPGTPPGTPPGQPDQTPIQSQRIPTANNTNDDEGNSESDAVLIEDAVAATPAAASQASAAAPGRLRRSLSARLLPSQLPDRSNTRRVRRTQSARELLRILADAQPPAGPSAQQPGAPTAPGSPTGAAGSPLDLAALARALNELAQQRQRAEDERAAAAAAAAAAADTAEEARRRAAAAAAAGNQPAAKAAQATEKQAEAVAKQAAAIASNGATTQPPPPSQRQSLFQRALQRFRRSGTRRAQVAPEPVPGRVIPTQRPRTRRVLRAIPGQFMKNIRYATGPEGRAAIASRSLRAARAALSAAKAVPKTVRAALKAARKLVAVPAEVMIVGERVSMSDDSPAEEAIYQGAERGFVSFQEKYFPGASSETLARAKALFGQLFADGSEFSLENPVPPADPADRKLLIDGLSNRFESLRAEVLELSNTHGPSSIITREGLEHVLRLKTLVDQLVEHEGEGHTYGTGKKPKPDAVPMKDEEVVDLLKKFATMIVHRRRGTGSNEAEDAIRSVESVTDVSGVDPADLPAVLKPLFGQVADKAEEDLGGVLDGLLDALKGPAGDTPAIADILNTINGMGDASAKEKILRLLTLLIEKYKEISAQLKECKDREGSLDGSIKDGGEALAAAQQAQKECQEKLAALQAELDKVRADAAAAAAAAAKPAPVDTSGLEKQIAALQAANDGLRVTIGTHEARIKKLEGQLAAAQKERDEKETALVGLRGIAEKVKQDTAAKETEIAAQRAAAASQIADLEGQLAALRKQRDELQAKYDASIAELNTKITALTGRVAGEEAAGVVKQKRISALEGELTAKEAQIREKEAKLEAEIRARELTEAAKKELEARINQLREENLQLEPLRNEVARLRGELKEAAAKLRTYEGMVITGRKAVSDLEAKCKKIATRIQRLSDQIPALERTAGVAPGTTAAQLQAELPAPRSLAQRVGEAAGAAVAATGRAASATARGLSRTASSVSSAARTASSAAYKAASEARAGFTRSRTGSSVPTAASAASRANNLSSRSETSNTADVLNLGDATSAATPLPDDEQTAKNASGNTTGRTNASNAAGEIGATNGASTVLTEENAAAASVGNSSIYASPGASRATTEDTGGSLQNPEMYLPPGESTVVTEESAAAQTGGQFRLFGQRRASNASSVNSAAPATAQPARGRSLFARATNAARRGASAVSSVASRAASAASRATSRAASVASSVASRASSAARSAATKAGKSLEAYQKKRAEEAVLKAKQRLLDIKLELERLVEEQRKCAQDVAEAKRKLLTFEENERTLRAELEAARDEAAAERTKAAELQTSYNIAMEKLQKLSKTVDSYEQTLADVEAQLETEQDPVERARLESMQRQLKAKIAQIQAETDKTQATIAQLQTDLAAAQTTLAAFQAEKEAQLLALRRELEAERDKAVAAKQAEIDALRKELEECRAKAAEMEAELRAKVKAAEEAAEQAAAKAEAEVKTIQTKLDDTTGAFTAAKATWEAEEASLRSQIEALQARQNGIFATLRAQLDELKRKSDGGPVQPSQLEILNPTLDEIDKIIEYLFTIVFGTTEKSAKLEGQIAELLEKIEELKKNCPEGTIDQLKARVAELEGLLDGAQKELTEKDKELDGLREQLRRLADAIISGKPPTQNPFENTNDPFWKIYNYMISQRIGVGPTTAANENLCFLNYFVTAFFKTLFEKAPNGKQTFEALSALTPGTDATQLVKEFTSLLFASDSVDAAAAALAAAAVPQTGGGVSEQASAYAANLAGLDATVKGHLVENFKTAYPEFAAEAETSMIGVPRAVLFSAYLVLLREVVIAAQGALAAAKCAVPVTVLSPFGAAAAPTRPRRPSMPIIEFPKSIDVATTYGTIMKEIVQFILNTCRTTDENKKQKHIATLLHRFAVLVEAFKDTSKHERIKLALGKFFTLMQEQNINWNTICIRGKYKGKSIQQILLENQELKELIKQSISFLIDQKITLKFPKIPE